MKSKNLQMLKRGESLTFDPSYIPVLHGELVNVGDIIFKDALITHRAHYLALLLESRLRGPRPCATPARGGGRTSRPRSS